MKKREDDIIDKIFKDDDLRRRFEMASMDERNKILGLK